jgi:hypothetical protein
MDGCRRSISLSRLHLDAARRVLHRLASARRCAAGVGLISAAVLMVAPIAASARVRLADFEMGSARASDERTGAMRVPDTLPRFGEDDPGILVVEPSKVTIYRADPPPNFELDLRLNPTSDDAESDVALRLVTPRDYYVVRVDGHGERVTFSRISEGRSHEIASVERRIAPNAWHSLHVRAQDNRFTVTIDGEWLFTAYDAVLQQPGRLAVWTGVGGAVQFDAIAVTPLAPE